MSVSTFTNTLVKMKRLYLLTLANTLWTNTNKQWTVNIKKRWI